MASSTGAELLNEKWDALSERFDLLKTVPRDQAQLINAAISDWQDYYWGNYDHWSGPELVAWQDRYLKTARLLDAVAAKTTVASSVTTTDDYHAPTGKVTVLPPLLVTARPPEPAYVPPPPIVYESKPYLPPPAQVTVKGLGTVDTSGWSGAKLASLTTYSRDPGTTGWIPTGGAVRPDRKGLIALAGAIGAFIVGKRAGWL